jgi:arginase
LKLVGVPSSQGSLEKNLGCEFASRVLIESGFFDSFERSFVEVVGNDVEGTDKAIFEAALSVFPEKCVFVGGDHSISYSLVRAFSKKFVSPSLIVFDAHADAVSFFKPVSHEDMNRVLVEDGIIGKENLLIVGLRRVWDGEKAWLDEMGVKTISADEIKLDFEGVKRRILDFVRERENVYVSVDLDVLDSGEFFATGYPEPGGLSEEELGGLLGVVRSFAGGFDVVEYNPLMDSEGRCERVALGVLKSIVL